VYHDGDALLRERETAQLLNFSPRTLAAWRLRHRGPRFVKFARNSVRYRRADVVAFIESLSRDPVEGAR
jgi:predicted DNA-binding transcriptional regulator AlpA